MLAPAGTLFAAAPSPVAQSESRSANWESRQQPTRLFRNIQDLAYRVAKDVGPLRVNQLDTPWMAQATTLIELKHHVNKMSEDLFHLTAMRKELAPPQQKLLSLMTPRVHELIYQTRAAIKEMNAKQSDMALAMTPYQQNIDIIGRQSDKIQNSIAAISHFQQARTTSARLKKRPSRATS